MALVINTNVASLNTQRNVSNSQSLMAQSMQRLSTGLRINSAKDDAAGLAISQRMTSQINGMNVAIRNSNDAISMMQTTEGAMATIGDNVQRIRDLAVQSANGAISNSDRTSLQNEVDQLTAENNRLVTSVKFNGNKVLDGTMGATVDFQVGANSGDKITVDFTKFDMSALNSASASTASLVDISTAAAAATALTNMDTDIGTINTARAATGAYQNRFQAVVSNLQTSVENTSASRGRITDADYAAESASMTKTQILQQAGVAMLSQANSMPQSVLSLLR